MSIFGVFLVHIQYACWEIRARKTRNKNAFHAVLMAHSDSAMI